MICCTWELGREGENLEESEVSPEFANEEIVN